MCSPAFLEIQTKSRQLMVRLVNERKGERDGKDLQYRPRRGHPEDRFWRPGAERPDREGRGNASG